jgi:hypothetical protein
MKSSTQSVELMFPHSGSRLTWLWALLIGLSVLRGSIPLWLPPDSPLQQLVCRLMPGLATCGR